MHPKIQHYVPQYLLRRFLDAEGTLHVFDKQESKKFATSNVRNVAAEKALYDLALPSGQTASLEPLLAEREAAASLVIDDIVKKGEIGFLSESQREDLARFAAVQLVRGPSHKRMATDLVAEMRARLIEGGVREGELEEQLPPMDDDAARRSLHRMVLAAGHLLPHFLDKAWILLESAEDHPFWISDAPVTVHRSGELDPFIGHMGVALRGAQIYMPLSPRFAVNLLCKSLENEILDVHSDVARARRLSGQLIDPDDGVGQMTDGIHLGYAVPCTSDHVGFFNSLQVLLAERWLFSRHDNFSRAEQLLEQNPRYRRGPRTRLVSVGEVLRRSGVEPKDAQGRSAGAIETRPP